MSSTYKLTFLANDHELDTAIEIMEDRLNATAVSTTKTESDEIVWTCEAYFVERPADQDISDILKTFTAYSVSQAIVPDIEELPEVDWVAKVQKDLAPVKIGNFVIHGSHDRNKLVNHPLNIEIDAGQAFGTAHHGTTKGCLSALQTVFKIGRFKNVLDLGTGTGILAIAAHKLDRSIDICASDIDKVSTEVASENAKVNQLYNMIDFIHAPGLAHQRLKHKLPFDLIIANILAKPLIQLAPELSRATKKNGFVILSGLLQTQEREVLANYKNNGFSIVKRIPIDEWMTLILKKSAGSISLQAGECNTALSINKLF